MTLRNKIIVSFIYLQSVLQPCMPFGPLLYLTILTVIWRKLKFKNRKSFLLGTDCTETEALETVLLVSKHHII